MAIRCDECKEKVSHLRTFSFIITGILGGSMSMAMLSAKFQLLGALIGLGVAIKILYNFNPKHWKHCFKFIKKIKR